MFDQITSITDQIISIRAEGILTDEDYKKFLPELERILEREGRMSAYVDLEDLKGWEVKAAWDDFKFGIAHNADFDRIAVVGDSRWQEWMIKVSNLFFAAKMRYFSPGEKQQALDWLQENRPGNS